MTDTEELPQTNGISDLDEEERARMRPADIDADVREMERRKRVEVIMNSKLFREELERIIETQLKEGSGTSALMQQISDMMGVTKQQGNVFKSSSCVIPINDIRGIESMGYAKGEKILRCKLAAVYRLIDLYGWSISPNTLVTVRLNQNDEHFLVNPYGMLFHEMTASSLIKVDMQGNVVEQGTTNFCVNIASFSLHAAVHAARPDIKCIIHVHTPAVVAVSALKQGLLPISKESVVVGDISIHGYLGGLLDHEEKDKLARNLGPNNKVLVLTNQGALCCGETIEEAFFNARNTVLASETQLKLIPVGIENLNVLSDEARKRIYEAAHKAPASSPRPDQPSILEAKVERKWRVGGVEFEGLMRMLDNAGFRTGYIYRHPLVKGDPPRPRNDVEVPPAVSSLGYLLEEEELYKQGLWKKLEGGRKGHDRSRWLNSPNVYQKVEILETGTTDPKKITKWVAEASPAHSSTPVKIDDALQFVPKNTNPKEFKQKQQQIKDYRRADKISAGPQSHILEGVSWEEARKMQDAAVTQTGDQVVLMGAASKGIIQRGHQHNATVYKSPYAKNPFDSVTDEELDEYKKVVEKKAKGEYDTDFSESELSSAAVNKRMDSFRSPSETEEESRDEHQVLRIETKQAPRPSQPEVVLSDGSLTESFLQAERASDISNRSDNMVEEKIGYRTNSHYGLPKGSFMNPNPVHFHIARVCQVALPDKPNVISAGSCKLGVLYKPKINRKENRLITIKIGDIDFVEYKVPLDTLRDIVTPLAQFLETFPKQVENQFSQTSYVKRSASTQIEIGENSEDGTKQKRSSSYDYERKILEELREALFTDCYFDDNVSIDSKWVESTHEHDENDSLFTNESLIEISSVDEQLLESLLDCDCEKRSNESLEMSKRKILFSVLPFKDCELKSSDYLCSLTSNFSDFKKVILDAKNILNRIPGDVIPDAKCSATISSNEDDENGPLENDIIIDETIDENDMKNNSFDNFSIYMLNKEEQSTPELKIQQEHQKVEKTFTQCDIFTQKTDDETLSPTGRKSQKVSKITKDAKEIIVTSFKKHESPNSRGETFWMSIDTAEGLKKQDQQGHLRINQVRNVDEIPLRPPPELLLQPQKRQLKQFKFREGLLETTCRQKSRNDTKPESESEDSDKENQNFMYEKQENHGCDDIPNEAAEKPEVNVLLFNSVTFNRTKTVNFTSYEVSKSVTIERNSDHSPTLSTEEESFLTAQSTQNDGDEDWMGFPGAKF